MLPVIFFNNNVAAWHGMSSLAAMEEHRQQAASRRRVYEAVMLYLTNEIEQLEDARRTLDPPSAGRTARGR